MADVERLRGINGHRLDAALQRNAASAASFAHAMQAVQCAAVWTPQTAMRRPCSELVAAPRPRAGYEDSLNPTASRQCLSRNAPEEWSLCRNSGDRRRTAAAYDEHPVAGSGDGMLAFQRGLVTDRSFTIAQERSPFPHRSSLRIQRESASCSQSRDHAHGQRMSACVSGPSKG